MGLIAWFFYLKPRWLQLLWGRCIGALLRIGGFRGSVMEENIQRAFPDKDEAFRRELMQETYRHIGCLIIELLFLFGPMPRFIRRYTVAEGGENWRKAKSLGKGVIFVSSHVGNWEVMAASGAMKIGIDPMIVTKRLKPAWLHRAIERGRLRCGVLGAYEPRTLRDVMAHLDRGGTVAFVMDQYSGPPVGVRVPVFGVPVGTPAIIATLARRTGAPVLPVTNYRKPDGHFVASVRPALDWKKMENPKLEIAENTAAFARVLEKDIYAHPGQWLWTHRRFKGDLGPLLPGEWEEGRAR